MREFAVAAESPAKPIVVWQLWRTPDQGLWCVATKVGHLYALALCRDTTQRPRPMRERFADIVSLVQHADQVKEDFLAMGWREPEPDLHPHGSWAYGRLTLVPSSWGTGAGAAGQPDDTASLDD